MADARGHLAVWVGEAKHPVTIAFADPRAITLEALRIHAIEDEPVVAVACALAPLLGAFELRFAGVMAIVDGARSAEEITREMRRAQALCPVPRRQPARSSSSCATSRTSTPPERDPRPLHFW